MSDVGGCTELIQDGINGYVVKDLDTFDIEKIKKIPKLKAYTGTSIDEWCEYLGGAEYKKKPLKEQPKVKIQAIQDYTDMVLGKDITEGDIYEVTPERANEIVKGEYAKICGKRQFHWRGLFRASIGRNQGNTAQRTSILPKTD